MFKFNLGDKVKVNHPEDDGGLNVGYVRSRHIDKDGLMHKGTNLPVYEIRYREWSEEFGSSGQYCVPEAWLELLPNTENSDF